MLTGYTKNKSQSSPVTDDRRVTDTASRTSSAAETTDFPANTIPQSQQERKGEGKESAADDNQQAKTDALTEKMPEPETENIIQPEEVPETMRKNSTAPQGIRYGENGVSYNHKNFKHGN